MRRAPRRWPNRRGGSAEAAMRRRWLWRRWRRRRRRRRRRWWRRRRKRRTEGVGRGWRQVGAAEGDAEPRKRSAAAAWVQRRGAWWRWGSWWLMAAAAAAAAAAAGNGRGAKAHAATLPTQATKSAAGVMKPTRRRHLAQLGGCRCRGAWLDGAGRGFERRKLLAAAHGMEA